MAWASLGKSSQFVAKAVWNNGPTSKSCQGGSQLHTTPTSSCVLCVSKGMSSHLTHCATLACQVVFDLSVCVQAKVPA